MICTVKRFEALGLSELYDLLKLRSDVFVVEQNCIYRDIDDKDRSAFHVIGKEGGEIVAYARIFKAGDYFKESAIGRIAVKKEKRKQGYGHEVVQAAVDFIHTAFKENTIVLSAQQYLVKFYEAHGFTREGEGYPEDGIPHIKMIKR